jgi:hypothetical protein
LFLYLHGFPWRPQELLSSSRSWARAWHTYTRTLPSVVPILAAASLQEPIAFSEQDGPRWVSGSCARASRNSSSRATLVVCDPYALLRRDRGAHEWSTGRPRDRR